jgi:hypothetical protein
MTASPVAPASVTRLAPPPRHFTAHAPGIEHGCQLWLKMPAWGLGIATVMLLIAIGMYLLAQFGQKIGAQQTFLLHQIYEEAAGQTVEIR